MHGPAAACRQGKSGRCGGLWVQKKARQHGGPVCGLGSVDVAVAVAAAGLSGLEDDDLATMQQPVEQGAGKHGVVGEGHGPVFEGAVGGEDDGATLVASTDNLKEQVGTFARDGQIP